MKEKSLVSPPDLVLLFFVLIDLTIAGLCLLNIPNIGMAQSANFLQYQNNSSGLSIQYPADWTKEEGDNFLVRDGVENIVTFIPPGGTNSSGIYHTYLAVNMDPNPSNDLITYLTDTIGSYKSRNGFTIIDSNTNTTLADTPAYMLVYTDSNIFDSKTVEIGTIFNGKGYYISYQADQQAYDVFFPTVSKMISSLSLQTTSSTGVRAGGGGAHAPDQAPPEQAPPEQAPLPSTPTPPPPPPPEQAPPLR